MNNNLRKEHTDNTIVDMYKRLQIYVTWWVQVDCGIIFVSLGMKKGRVINFSKLFIFLRMIVNVRNSSYVCDKEIAEIERNRSADLSVIENRIKLTAWLIRNLILMDFYTVDVKM